MDIIEEHREKWKRLEYENTHELNSKNNETNRK